jgi:four helix bundle protein
VNHCRTSLESGRDDMGNATIELKQRCTGFAVSLIQVFRLLPKSEEARIVGRQVLRSGTSMAANYRAACRSRSRAEFTAKIGVVVEEADETVFWLELLVESGVVKPESLAGILREANELLAIFAASQRTVRSRVASARQ